LTKINLRIDPDKFPIFSLIESIEYDDLISLWDYKPEINKKIFKQLGFNLTVKESNLEHHEAGEGVFVNCEESIPPGTLLGFVPGVIFEYLTDFLK